MKQMGARNAGNPHVACDVEGAGDVERSRYLGRPARQSSTLPVRGGDGNIPTYSAVLLPQPCDEVREGAFLAQPGVVTEEGEPAGGMKFKQPRPIGF